MVSVCSMVVYIGILGQSMVADTQVLICLMFADCVVYELSYKYLYIFIYFIYLFILFIYVFIYS